MRKEPRSGTDTELLTGIGECAPPPPPQQVLIYKNKGVKGFFHLLAWINSCMYQFYVFIDISYPTSFHKGFEVYEKKKIIQTKTNSSEYLFCVCGGCGVVI